MVSCIDHVSLTTLVLYTRSVEWAIIDKMQNMPFREKSHGEASRWLCYTGSRWLTLDGQQETSRSVYAPKRMGFMTGMRMPLIEKVTFILGWGTYNLGIGDPCILPSRWFFCFIRLNSESLHLQTFCCRPLSQETGNSKLRCNFQL